MTQAERLSAALAGRYRIERELGAGGMATVYLAEDLKHDRKVAIKVLKPELAAVLGAERFVVEIKTTAAMSHPHILPLFDSGTADGFLFYVMPYIQGETIREKLTRETQFGVDEAVRIAREVADALDYAHRHGVIHRDIKPENLLLHDGRAMVMDFGIALAVSAAAGGRMTETGLSLGTPHYMSPEQATAEKEITARSDVYSLASVCYEMLTGEPPHTAGSAQAVIMKIITDTARPVHELRKNVPANVDAALAKALEKLPADRFESAKAFADALGDAGFTVSGTRAYGQAGAARGRFAIAGWAAGTFAALALGAGYLIGKRPADVAPEQPVQFVVELPDSITAIARCCGPAQVLSRDGSTLVFVGMKGASGALYRRSIGQLTAELIPGTEGGSVPVFSPDGTWLAFEVDGQLKKLPMSGGPVVPVAASGITNGITWGDDDVLTYSARSVQPGGRLWRVSAAGGTPTAIPVIDSTARYFYPFALPGGKAVLVRFLAGGSSIRQARIGVLDLATGRVDSLGFGTRAAYADGMLFFVGADGTLMVQPFDPASRRTTGPSTSIVSGVALHGGSNHSFAVSEGGWLEYQIGSGVLNEKLGVLGPGGTTQLAIPGRPPEDFEDISISPDGRRVAVSSVSLGGGGDIWLLNQQNGTFERLTVGGGWAATWSRDGKRIAYSAGPPYEIYVRAVDQAGSPQKVLAGKNLYPTSWIPGDRTIVFNADNTDTGTRWDIGTITIGDTVPRWLVRSEFVESQPQVSHDGRWLAYTSNRTGRVEVYVQPMSGDAAPVQVSAEGGDSPRWSRDGRTLYYVASSNTLVAATVTLAGRVEVLTRKPLSDAGVISDLNTWSVNWDVFPDGKRFLFVDRGGVQGGRPRMVLIQNWKELARQMGSKK